MVYEIYMDEGDVKTKPIQSQLKHALSAVERANFQNPLQMGGKKEKGAGN
jgi:hypothetical protein